MESGKSKEKKKGSDGENVKERCESDPFYSSFTEDRRRRNELKWK